MFDEIPLVVEGGGVLGDDVAVATVGDDVAVATVALSSGFGCIGCERTILFNSKAFLFIGRFVVAVVAVAVVVCPRCC